MKKKWWNCRLETSFPHDFNIRMRAVTVVMTSAVCRVSFKYHDGKRSDGKKNELQLKCGCDVWVCVHWKKIETDHFIEFCRISKEQFVIFKLPQVYIRLMLLKVTPLSHSLESLASGWLSFKSAQALIFAVSTVDLQLSTVKRNFFVFNHERSDKGLFKNELENRNSVSVNTFEIH